MGPYPHGPLAPISSCWAPSWWLQPLLYTYLSPTQISERSLTSICAWTAS